MSETRVSVLRANIFPALYAFPTLSYSVLLSPTLSYCVLLSPTVYTIQRMCDLLFQCTCVSQICVGQCHKSPTCTYVLQCHMYKFLWSCILRANICLPVTGPEKRKSCWANARAGRDWHLKNSVKECFSFNVYIKSHLLDVLIQFFNYLTLLNLMRRFASLCLSSNQFWCSSYMTRCTLSYQPLHLLPFSWFLCFAMSKYWAFEESPIYRTQVQSTPACLFGPLCDFIELDTVHRNNNLRVHL